jgi:hypothetical protein
MNRCEQFRQLIAKSRGSARDWRQLTNVESSTPSKLHESADDHLRSLVRILAWQAAREAFETR